jgi:hypothetical protein|eukprot:COSAG01_NODE_4038_length_5412_cov_5.119706_3_plen_62_part_00
MASHLSQRVLCRSEFYEDCLNEKHSYSCSDEGFTKFMAMPDAGAELDRTASAINMANGIVI